MILFLEDWARFPSAIADYDTTNTSFVEFSSLLKSMGVKNYLFPLSLLQPELKGVDPFDPNLDEETIGKIWLECYYNFWYFLREVCLFPATTGSEHNRVRANRSIIGLCWVLMNNIDAFWLQPRQTGKSAAADAVSEWLMLIRSEGATHFLVTKDNGLLAKNIATLKKMRDILPPYFYIPNRKDKDTELYMNYSELGNEIVGKGGQKDPDSAEKVGRGLRFATCQNDEQPFCPYADIFVPAMTSAMDASRKEAIRKGLPNFFLTTTTAGDLTNRSGKYSFSLYNSGATFTEKMYDCKNNADLIDLVKKNRRGNSLRISGCFTHRMLGISDEEFWELITKVPSTPDQIDRDYFLVWTSGGQYSVLPPNIQKGIQESEREPDYVEITPTGYLIRWYAEEQDIESVMRSQDVIIASDTSEQVGRDATTFILRSTQSLATLATLQITNANLVVTAEWLASFMIKYPRTTLIMERKSTGAMFLDTLLLVFLKHNINPFKRIYNQFVQFPEKYPEQYRKLRNASYTNVEYVNANRKYFGFAQSGNTRNVLYSTVLQTAAKQAQHVVYDKHLSGELRGLVIKDGRVDHTSDSHDDLVMGWLLSHWFLMMGVNLDLYGIDTRRLLMSVSEDGRQFTEEDQLDNEVIDSLQEEAEQLTDLIRQTRHVGLQLKYRQRLDKINAELESYGVEAVNAQSIVEEVRDNSYARLRNYGLYRQ